MGNGTVPAPLKRCLFTRPLRSLFKGILGLARQGVLIMMVGALIGPNLISQRKPVFKACCCQPMLAKHQFKSPFIPVAADQKVENISTGKLCFLKYSHETLMIVTGGNALEIAWVSLPEQS